MFNRLNLYKDKLPKRKRLKYDDDDDIRNDFLRSDNNYLSVDGYDVDITIPEEETIYMTRKVDKGVQKYYRPFEDEEENYRRFPWMYERIEAEAKTLQSMLNKKKDNINQTVRLMLKRNYYTPSSSPSNKPPSPPKTPPSERARTDKSTPRSEYQPEPTTPPQTQTIQGMNDVNVLWDFLPSFGGGGDSSNEGSRSSRASGEASRSSRGSSLASEEGEAILQGKRTPTPPASSSSSSSSSRQSSNRNNLPVQSPPNSVHSSGAVSVHSSRAVSVHSSRAVSVRSSSHNSVRPSTISSSSSTSVATFPYSDDSR